MHEVEQNELRRRKGWGRRKDNHVYKNFVGAMVNLCERYGGEEEVEL